MKFRFTKDGVSYDKETLVTVSVHIKTVQEQIDALAAMFATDEGFALIKGENANRDIVKHPLKLVKSPGSYGLAGYSDVELIWTSSNTDIIAPPSYGSSSVKVNRPENGQPDADVILTVTVKKANTLMEAVRRRQRRYSLPCRQSPMKSWQRRRRLWTRRWLLLHWRALRNRAA